MAKSLNKEFTQKQYELRSLEMVAYLRGREDEAKSAVQSFAEPLDFQEATRHALCIDEDAWKHVVTKDYPPHHVFCHPDVLIAFPRATLYYRGMTGLSQKAVGQLATSVGSWEQSSAKHIAAKAATKVSCLFNAFISSIIKGTDEWLLENGYRTTLATLGITFDGSFRNHIGLLAEERVKALLLEFILAKQLNVADVNTNPVSLREGLSMHFSSEPDVYFKDSEDRVVATIEVKGGLDPAGALERLGASQKSFLEATRKVAKCQTYLVAGVITSEMEARLNQDRQFTKHFALVHILTDETARADFLYEVFHHGLRYKLD